MKGTIVKCLAEMITARFGADAWTTIVANAGLAEEQAGLTLAIADIPDAQVGQLLAHTCRHLKLQPQEAYDAFGEYWVCTYAPKMYRSIMNRFKSAKEMLVGLDSVHVDMTATIPNAAPPRFVYEWKSDKTLIVTYKSKRHMIDLYIGLVKGVGTYFKEPLKIRKLSEEQVEVAFA